MKSIYNFTPEFEWPYYRYSITGWSNGTYYLIAVAYNEYGNYTTACLKINILIPHIPSNGTIDDKFVFEWISYTIPSLITFGLLVVLIYLYYRRKKFRSK